MTSRKVATPSQSSVMRMALVTTDRPGREPLGSGAGRRLALVDGQLEALEEAHVLAREVLLGGAVEQEPHVAERRLAALDRQRGLVREAGERISVDGDQRHGDATVHPDVD